MLVLNGHHFTNRQRTSNSTSCLGGEPEGHGEERIGADTSGIEGSGAGWIEAGAAEGVADDAKDEDEYEHYDRGEEERCHAVEVDPERRRDYGGRGADRGGAEHPHEGQHAVADRRTKFS